VAAGAVAAARGLRRLRHPLLVALPARFAVLPSLFRAPYHPVVSWLSPTCAVGPRVAVFAHFDAAGEVAPRVLATLAALQAAGLSVLFVSNSGHLQPGAWAALRALCAGILVRRNVGYDFGALREALAFWQLPHPRTELVLLMNDSVLGPFGPLAEVLDLLDFSAADIWGATDSAQRGHHLQSWFLAVGRRALDHPAWPAFWAGVRPVTNKEYVVGHSELMFSQQMRRGGLRLRALWSQAAIEREVFAGPRAFSGIAELRQLARIRRYGNLGYALNPTADLWRQLLAAGCPFVKRELVDRNPAGVADGAEWEAAVAARWGRAP
jgi:hypothetical protein